MTIPNKQALKSRLKKTITKRLPLFVFLGFISSFPAQTKISEFRSSGLDASWHPTDPGLVVYSKKGSDKYYDIYLARTDTGFDTCLTCNHPALPNRHIANMWWHPGGNWIIFVAEKLKHPRGSVDALPGFGAFCDIWIISRDGKKCHKLIDIPNDYDHGVIAPKFSPDGKKIIWNDRIKRPSVFNANRHFGYWTVKTADIVWDKDSVPTAHNIKDLFPGKKFFIEAYGFSPDGTRIICCSNLTTKNAWKQQIFSFDSSGNNIIQLTPDSKFYNEHAFYSPDGKKIVWMSNKDNKNKGTDWWIMNTDGSSKQRTTFMNDPKHSQYVGKAVWAGMGSFNPSGTKFLWGVQKSLITQEGRIVIVELTQ
jgi:Tol biopolymer transport system component